MLCPPSQRDKPEASYRPIRFFTNLCVVRDPEGLRQQLSQDAKEQAELEGPEAGFTVERTVAERAFAKWPYSRITRWAAENGLAVDFTGSRTLILSVSVDFSHPSAGSW